MIGLIKKDILSLKHAYKVIALFGVICIVLACTSSDEGFPPMLIAGFFGLTISIPMSISAYDEQCDWDCFGNTLPISRTRVVYARYIAHLIIIIGIASIFALADIASVLFGQANSDFFFNLLALVACNLITVSIQTPFIYKFGVEKARLIFIGIVAALAAITPIIIMAILGKFSSGNVTEELVTLSDMTNTISFASDSGETIINLTPTFYAIIGVIGLAAVLFVLSMLISISIYKKKEF